MFMNSSSDSLYLKGPTSVYLLACIWLQGMRPRNTGKGILNIKFAKLLVVYTGLQIFVLLIDTLKGINTYIFKPYGHTEGLQDFFCPVFKYSVTQGYIVNGNL
jgi:hypothetical protein